MPLLTFSANDIDVSGLPVDVALPADWLTGELADAGVEATVAGQLKARLSRSGPADIVVHGRIQARVSAPCARCLGPAEIPVDAELALLLRPAKSGRHPGYLHRSAPRAQGGAAAGAGHSKSNGERELEYEFTAAEADLDLYDGETVVLDGFVREAILLELPSFPLCSEACTGIGRAAPGAMAEDEPPPPAPEPSTSPMPAAEERPASIADLRDRFAQRSGRIAGAPPSNETPKKKSKKE